VRWSKVSELPITNLQVQSHRGAHYSEIGLQVKEFNARDTLWGRAGTVKAAMQAGKDS